MAWSNEPARCHSNWTNLNVLISNLPSFIFGPVLPPFLTLLFFFHSLLHFSLNLPKCSNESVTECSMLCIPSIIGCQGFIFEKIPCCFQNLTLAALHSCYQVIKIMPLWETIIISCQRRKEEALKLWENTLYCFLSFLFCDFDHKLSSLG